MDNVIVKNKEKQADSGQAQLIGDYISSAMDIEDKILESSYMDYLDRKSWPANLDRQAFNTLVKYLTILIKETKMHQRMFLNLQNRLVLKNDKHD
jgi:hypothetical protein